MGALFAGRFARETLGADDFVAKPFNSEELLARVRSAIRRKTGLAPTGSRKFAHGSIDCERHLVTIRETPVELTLREFNLLWMLAEPDG